MRAKLAEENYKKICKEIKIVKRMLEIKNLKYTILRRAICDGNTKTKKHYTVDELKQLENLVESKKLEELKNIHISWIGYSYVSCDYIMKHLLGFSGKGKMFFDPKRNVWYHKAKKDVKNV